MLLFLKNVLFTVVVPGTVAVLIPYQLGSGRNGATLLWGSREYGALLPLSVGAAIYFRCVWDFARAGRGTPAPIDAPKVLVVRGLYQYVRNPIYLGVLLVVLGWVVYFGSFAVLLYGAGLSLLFHLFVVLVEEPMLERRFGESYERYCRAVHRWVPGKRYMPEA
ncbi:MAG: isoprenylcysteine carboxylmethyltransferase family protein [Nitrospinae bacterium]|nr:isoprenylcysteine carboxylmethyltransferase family protein [Nitrospinota bacterium]